LAKTLVTYKSDQSSLALAKDPARRLDNSSNPAYLDTLGWVRYKSGEFDTTVAALEQALKQFPDSKPLHYHLEMVQYGKGETKLARENLRRALEGDSKFYGLSEARATLNKLAKI
jgi:tetratricopeptide (TPR) repeat protein